MMARPRDGGRNTGQLGEKRRGARAVGSGRRIIATYSYGRSGVLGEDIGNKPGASLGGGAIQRMNDKALIGRVFQGRRRLRRLRCSREVALRVG